MDAGANVGWDEFWRLLALRDANTRVVLLGTGMLGLASGVIGSYAVLRRRSLVGDAVAHAALPGIAVAYFIVGTRSFAAFLLGALAFGLLATAAIAMVRAYTRVKEDAAIGIVIGSFFGLGLSLSKIIQDRPGGSPAGLDRFLLGSAASMVRADAWRIAGVAAAVLVAAGLLHKEFKLLCFDREFAASEGFPTLALDLLLMALVAVCTIVGLPAAGIVLMVALLIIPGVTARFWTERLGVMLAIAGGIGLASGVVGTALSAAVPAPAGGQSRGWPTGPMIVLSAASCFMVSMLASPRRGVAAAALRRRRMRRAIADQHLLRGVYELLEPTGDFRRSWRASDPARGGHDRARSGAVLRRAHRRGWIEPADGGWRLTEAGASEAARVVRAHRLWEMYLIEHAAIAPDHVDRDADELEHLLPPEFVARVEGALAMEGRPPGAVPASPHALTPGGLGGGA